VIRPGLYWLHFHYISRFNKGDKIREIHCLTDRCMDAFLPRTISDHNKHKTSFCYHRYTWIFPNTSSSHTPPIPYTAGVPTSRAGRCMLKVCNSYFWSLMGQTPYLSPLAQGYQKTLIWRARNSSKRCINSGVDPRHEPKIIYVQHLPEKNILSLTAIAKVTCRFLT
jgi:hypothetical protein